MSRRHYREMTSPARSASLVCVGAARTAGTGSGGSQTSAAALDERSLRRGPTREEKNFINPTVTCAQMWQHTAFSMSYVIINNLRALCVEFIFQSGGPVTVLLLHTSNPTTYFSPNY